MQSCGPFGHALGMFKRPWLVLGHVGMGFGATFLELFLVSSHQALATWVNGMNPCNLVIVSVDTRGEEL